MPVTVWQIVYYQLPHIYCIVAHWPDNKGWLSLDMCLYQVMMTFHFLNEGANDAEWTQKSIITS